MKISVFRQYGKFTAIGWKRTRLLISSVILSALGECAEWNNASEEKMPYENKCISIIQYEKNCAYFGKFSIQT